MPETIWIMRHGLAENQFDSDFNRALSATGAKQAQSVAQQIMADGLMPTRLIASPYRRTQETAQVVRDTLGLDLPIESDEQFVHFADHRVAASYLAALDDPAVMVISHMPIVAKMSQYLDASLTLSGFQTAQALRFDKTAGQLRATKNYLPQG